MRRLTLWLSGALERPASAATSLPTPQPTPSPDINDAKDFKSLHSPLPAAAPPSLTIEFAFGHTRVKLNLAKTTYPIYRLSGDKSTIVNSHVLAVVTSISSGRLEYPSAIKLPKIVTPATSLPPTPSTGAFTSSTPSPAGFSAASSISSIEKLSVSQADEVAKSLPTAGIIATDDVKQPLFLRRDGSIVQRLAPTKQSAAGLSYGILKLLESTNWASTPLGERAAWPPMLELLVSWVVNSPLPAGLWCDKDLVFIYNQAYSEVSGRWQRSDVADKDSISRTTRTSLDSRAQSRGRSSGHHLVRSASWFLTAHQW